MLKVYIFLYILSKKLASFKTLIFNPFKLNQKIMMNANNKKSIYQL